MTSNMHRGSLVLLLALTPILCGVDRAAAQLPELRSGEVVPRDIREMYERGLKYLALQQSPEGGWQGSQGGPGVDGLCVMCFLACGEDPNYGIYADNVQKGVQAVLRAQNKSTGYYGNSMYHHGFAMLAMAEAYGAVDDRQWSGHGEQLPSIGASLELAVRSAVTSQKKNQLGAWRYSPDSNDADTSVSGAVLVGLLAARNAGIEVPDESIDRAIAYYKSMTSDSGQVAYAGMGGFDNSPARISIGSLVYAIARRKDIPQYEATVRNLSENLEAPANGYTEYTRYYRAQALFQGDYEAWQKWNRLLVRTLKESQNPDGSFQGDFGPELGTSMSLLSLALNYRFLPIYER